MSNWLRHFTAARHRLVGRAPRSVKVAVYLAASPHAMLDGYHPTTPVTLGDQFTLDLPTQVADSPRTRILARPTEIADTVSLERIFAALNGHPEPDDEHHTTRWYAARNRSLSVGDIVALDTRYYACASTGWQRVDPPE
ncbi:hypothetical protein ACFWUP_30210 [Nocardia sp. NPDC058658]|uniref:hypothetical protein n=1 Tax=Nocardia sp. NPDC058658 TaxID=3346580 RepID=UPI0036650BD2